MFSKILHANDGSEHAFHALALALEIASQNNSELHMVSVEEISYMPNSIEEIREETGTAARRFHTVLQRARAMAAEQNVTLKTHVIAGSCGARHPRSRERIESRIARHWRHRPFGVL